MYDFKKSQILKAEMFGATAKRLYCVSGTRRMS